MSQETIKRNLSTRTLYLWSIAGMVLGAATVFFVRYLWTVTPCGDGACNTLRNVAGVVQPLGILIFLAGLALLIATAVRYFILRRKRQES